MSQNTHANSVKRFILNQSRNIKNYSSLLPGFSSRSKTVFSLAAILSLSVPAAVLSLAGNTPVTEENSSPVNSSSADINFESHDKSLNSSESISSNSQRNNNKMSDKSSNKENTSIKVEVNGRSITLPETSDDVVIKEKIETEGGQTSVHINSSQKHSTNSDNGRNRTRVKIDSDIDSDSSFDSETRIRIRESD